MAVPVLPRLKAGFGGVRVVGEIGEVGDVGTFEVVVGLEKVLERI
jgi:hypothetical protein